MSFGKLTVRRFVEFRSTPGHRDVPYVEVDCECGEKKTVSLWDLRAGRTKSCGFNHPHYEDRSMPAFNAIYSYSYKKRALAAGLEFTITREQFRDLTQKACHYCGAPPTGKSQKSSARVRDIKRGAIKTGTQISQYIYNGLDRIDSALGYTVENVVPCCGVCNHAKHTMSYADFTAWLDRVADFRR